MPVDNLMEYGDNYLEASEILQQYCRDEPNTTLTDSDLFKCKLKISGFKITINWN